MAMHGSGWACSWVTGTARMKRHDRPEFRSWLAATRESMPCVRLPERSMEGGGGTASRAVVPLCEPFFIVCKEQCACMITLSHLATVARVMRRQRVREARRCAGMPTPAALMHAGTDPLLTGATDTHGSHAWVRRSFLDARTPMRMDLREWVAVY